MRNPDEQVNVRTNKMVREEQRNTHPHTYIESEIASERAKMLRYRKVGAGLSFREAPFFLCFPRYDAGRGGVYHKPNSFLPLRVRSC